MKIGFVQPEEVTVDEQVIGYAESSVDMDGEETSWSSWVRTVFLHFCMVNGMIAIVRDLVHFFWGR